MKIIKNALKCLKCGDEIESKSVHDSKWCSCKNIFIDGGKEYMRFGGDGIVDKTFEDMFIAVDEKLYKIFLTINAVAFSGNLDLISLCFRKLKHLKGIIYYSPLRIVVARRFANLDYTEEASDGEMMDCRKVLLHEMVHLFIHQNKIKEASSVFLGHSDKFKGIYEEKKKTLGWD